MLRHFVRFLIRNKRFAVYHAFPARTRAKMAYNALTLTRPRIRRRLASTRPDVDTSNGILPDAATVENAVQAVLDLGLVPHYGRAKNWDFLKALALLTDELDGDDPILDAGCGAFSVLLEWLDAAGHRNLHGCDYVVERPGRVGRIEYSKQDLTATTYPDASFAAVTCLSVIEHNVDVERFLDEAHRLLRPGGLLIVSTDYWPEKIDTTGVRPFGDTLGETRIFDERELRAFVAAAQAGGFRPLTPMRYAAHERVVRWRLVPEPYTFAFMAFRKPLDASAHAPDSSGEPGSVGTGISTSVSTP